MAARFDLSEDISRLLRSKSMRWHQSTDYSSIQFLREHLINEGKLDRSYSPFEIDSSFVVLWDADGPRVGGSYLFPCNSIGEAEWLLYGDPSTLRVATEREGERYDYWHTIQDGSCTWGGYYTAMVNGVRKVLGRISASGHSYDVFTAMERLRGGAAPVSVVGRLDVGKRGLYKREAPDLYRLVVDQINAYIGDCLFCRVAAFLTDRGAPCGMWYITGSERPLWVDEPDPTEVLVAIRSFNFRKFSPAQWRRIELTIKRREWHILVNILSIRHWRDEGSHGCLQQQFEDVSVPVGDTMVKIKFVNGQSRVGSYVPQSSYPLGYNLNENAHIAARAIMAERWDVSALDWVPLFGGFAVDEESVDHGLEQVMQQKVSWLKNVGYRVVATSDHWM